MSGTKKQSEENLDEVATDDSDETLIPLHTDDTVIPATAAGEKQVEDESAVAGGEGKAGTPDTGQNDIESLKQNLEEQKRIAAENHDRILRAQAELDNMRKRATRDIENAHRYALERFIADLLPVLDSMEMGVSASSKAEGIDSMVEGLNLTLKLFSSTLEKFGVKVIDPQGEKFNPELHEAVSMQESENSEAGTVITVMQKGYELNGRLIRPAMVVVVK